MARKPENNALKILLWLPSVIYGFIVGVRNKLFDLNILHSEEFDIPIISVGNISVGGTGKTPFVEFLVSILSDDYKVAILSRGYKRKTKEFVLSDENSTVEEIGDEPLQMKRKFPNITVAVDRERVHGINKLKDDFKDLDIVLLDDAFQHRYVKPGLSILLVDYNQPISSDHYLPLGRLREHPSEKSRANIVVVTKCPENIKPMEQRIIVNDLMLFPYQQLFFTTVKYGDIKPVFTGKFKLLSRRICKEGKYNILLVTGIANSRPLRKQTRSISPKISEIKFPDHHQYTQKDFKKINRNFKRIPGPNKIILTTEKDAMRLRNLQDFIQPGIKNWYYIPIEVSFHNNKKESFQTHIRDYVTTNKRNSILSSDKD